MTKTFIIEFIAGAAGYQARKWFGEETMRYVVKPLFGPPWRFLKRSLKKIFIRSEKHALILVHSFNYALNKDHNHRVK